MYGAMGCGSPKQSLAPGPSTWGMRCGIRYAATVTRHPPHLRVRPLASEEDQLIAVDAHSLHVEDVSFEQHLAGPLCDGGWRWPWCCTVRGLMVCWGRRLRRGCTPVCIEKNSCSEPCEPGNEAGPQCGGVDVDDRSSTTQATWQCPGSSHCLRRWERDGGEMQAHRGRCGRVPPQHWHDWHGAVGRCTHSTTPSPHHSLA